MRNIPKTRHTNATKPFERLHMDLGEMPFTLYDDCNVFLTIKDEFSQLTTNIPLEGKDCAFKEFEKWFNEMKNQLDHPQCKVIQSDNGTEFLNSKFFNFFKDETSLLLLPSNRMCVFHF